LLLLLPCGVAAAQEFPGEHAWRPLLKHEGVVFRYLYYRHADGHHNAGVVLMIENTNDYDVTYAFKMIFRSAEDVEIVKEVEGTLASGQRKTGSHDGLFWIPWEDQRPIASLGMRGYKVAPVPKEQFDFPG